MAKIDITTAKNVIESNPRKAYFKIKNTGGPRGATGEQGPRGIPGSDGAQGVPGKAATVTVGSTTTLPAGSNATVTNSGDQYDAVLEFGIPTGPQGPTGATGAQGPRGFQGEKGAKGDTGAAATITLGSVSTGAAGTDAAIVNTGDEHNAVYNFTIPRGAKGDTGTSPTVSVYGTETLPAGSQATVTNVGTSQDVQLQFGIPQGEAGKNTKLYSSIGQNTDGAMSQKATTDALAPKLEAEVVTELPPTGDDGKLYLTPKNYTTGTATGNPITISLGEDAGQITSAQLDGDTCQQTYTGKNLFSEKYETSASNLTIAFNKDTGVLKITGTSNSEWVAISKNHNQGIPLVDIASGTTVSFAYTMIKSDGFRDWAMRVRNNETPNLSTNDLSSARLTKTLSTDCNYTMLWLRTTAGGTVDIEAKGIQLTASATPDYDYEPFVGGVPSPSPDYPQQIQTVTGEQTVTVVGKNLISANWESGRYNNSTGAKEPYSDNVRTDAPISVQPNTTYICSRNGSGLAMNILQYKADGSFISVTTISSGNSFTTGSDTYFITMFRGTSGGTEGIQLELGSTITSYVPYHATSYPINLGKNLFDNTGWEQGQYSNGVWGGGNTKRATSGFIQITGGTYTMSLNSTDNKTALINLNYFDSAKTWLGNRTTLGLEAFGDTDRVKTFTLPNNASYLRVTVRPYSGDDKGDNVVQYAPSEKLQVEAGSTNTPYAPYFTPIELCKLGTYQDYIWKDGKDWKVHKAIGSNTFDGTETWSQSGDATTTVYTALANLISAGLSYAFVGHSLSKMDGFHFINDGATPEIGAFKLVTNTSGVAEHLRLMFDKTAISTVASAKAWIAANKPKLYAVLYAPTDTTITDTNLIAQLEAVRNATLQASNTITNTATGTNLAGDLELGYEEYNPTNRYDKWLWLDLNNNYEQLGS